MNESQREQVRSNAKYLRSVRPLDPEEIYEYVEGEPHPAAVGQVLRESAVELGIVERPDGTFVPVERGPVSVAFESVESFPDPYARTLEDLLVAEYGPEWDAGDSGDRLRERLRAVKEAYLRGAPVEYDAETALAYAVYHLPDYYATAQYVFAELAGEGLLGRDIRVVDVGAGVGGPALGLGDLIPDDALLDYHAVEPSDAADVLEAMLAETGRNVHTTVHRETAEAFDPDSLPAREGEDRPDGVDVVLFSNVLSELADPAAVVRRYGEALAPGGTVVAVAPADRNTAVGLRRVERSVADDGPFTVYAPTVRLWPGVGPTDDCWSFDVRPDIEVPAFQRRLQDAADHDTESGAEATDRPGEVAASDRPGEFVNVDVQYAYSFLRLDGRRRYDVALDAGTVARFADAEDHVTNRVDCYAVKLSHDLSEGGNPLFRVGDGSQRTAHFAVCTKESALNRDLLTADYGDLLAAQNVLVLWNDDEGAYNLVVDGETVVDRVPG